MAVLSRIDLYPSPSCAIVFIRFVRWSYILEGFMQFEIARLSSKGQLVIPGKVRKLLGLRTGTKLAMFHDGESIYLKPIPAPDLSGFRKLASEAKKTALNAKKTGAKK